MELVFRTGPLTSQPSPAQTGTFCTPHPFRAHESPVAKSTPSSLDKRPPRPFWCLR